MTQSSPRKRRPSVYMQLPSTFMDQVSSTSDDVIEAQSNSESDSLACPPSLFPDSEPKCRTDDENKKINPHNSVEMDRTCIRPMNTDDIISKELPFKILDTDFDGKDENSMLSPAESQLLDVPNIASCERTRSIDDEPGQPCTKTSDEQFKADIIEQDTGYSSDSGENIKSASSESIELVETTEDEPMNQLPDKAKESTEPVTSMTNEVDFEACKAGIASNTDSQTSLVSEQGSTDTDKGDFVPTIIGIRGACDSSTLNGTSTSSNSKEVEVRTSMDTSLQQINIVNVQGSCEKIPKPGEDGSKFEEIHIIDDSDDTNQTESCDPTTSYNTDLDIKQEPPEMVDSSDCLYDNTQNEDGRFTSEIFIEEEKANDKEKEEEEIICIESSGKIPLPIPIKTESRIDGGEQSETSQCVTTSKESNLSTTLICSLPVVKNAIVFSTAGYTCHMCNMTFQEYESLNEHMTLHRNNLVDPNKMKQKAKPTCPICKRQLSTLQSLQQHIKTHNEEKPHVCNICSKAFRHQSNYRMHLQKHESEKAEKTRCKVAARKNVPLAPRTVDRYKPNNFLYSTQVTNQAPKTNTSKTSLSSSPSFRRDNAKENVNLLYKSFTCRSRGGEMITRTRIVDDTDDDVIPLKTFSNVENIVMNAARFIVKVDSIDPNVLKRRIKTPDISIDKNAISSCRRPGEKSKIVLSPSDNSKRLKLDQIENIIMESDTEADQIPANFTSQDDDQDYDYDYGDDYDDFDSDGAEAAKTDDKSPENLTDKEECLLPSNNDYESKNESQNDPVSELRRNAQMILKSEAEKSKNSQSNSSNVIMLKNLSTKRTPSPATSYLSTSNESFVTEAPYESYSNESSDDEIAVSDRFDKAFHRVALRRLLLIQKRAAKNNGKVDSKYLLGPRFWRKALRRAKSNPIDFDVNTFPDSTPSQSPDLTDVNKYYKLDERRTNDPERLQTRAENKLSFMLDKIRLTNNMSNLNLMGPLFWKRTLQLAGVHRPRDLPGLLNKERLSLQDVEFVDDELSSNRPNKNISCRADSNTSDILPKSAAIEVKKDSGSKKDCDSTHQNSELVDRILSDVVLTRSSRYQSNETKKTESSSSAASVKNSSILYDSLTKPRTSSSKSTDTDSVVATNADEKTRESGNASLNVNNGPSSSTTVDSNSEVVDANCPSDVTVNPVADGEMNGNAPTVEVDANIGNTNIVLNVDENFQLITSGGDKLAELSGGTNYVLVSDETGAMQLVKENDLRLVESNDANGDAQYVVNLQGENYPALGLMGQENGEQQVSYALQFDGENYTAIQLVQNNVAEEEGKMLKSDAGNVCDATMTLKSAEAAETTSFVLPAVATDLNSIGKELSDFLNLNYDALNEK